MPYAQDQIGIYKIVNTTANECYVGQSQRVKKRMKEHFRLLNKQTHPNSHLQRAYNKYGREAFVWTLEVECEDINDLDLIEEAFLVGEAEFDQPVTYNIANFAKAPMRGKKHTEEAINKIKAANAAREFDYMNAEWRNKLKAGQKERFFSDPDWVARLKFILDNDHMSYAERARRVGRDISCTRRTYLKYQHLKGTI